MPPTHLARLRAVWIVCGLSGLIGVARPLVAQSRPPHVRGDTSAAPMTPTRTTDESFRQAVEAQLRASAAPDGIPQDAWRRTVRLYQTDHFAPFWLTDQALGPRVDALIAALDRADRHALRRADYPLAATLAAARTATESPAAVEALAHADVLLTATCVAYAGDLLAGRVDPRTLEPGWHIASRSAFVDSVLGATLRAADLAAALQALEPQVAGYATLVAALAEYRARAGQGGWMPVPAGPTLHLRDVGTRVTLLRTRLMAEGYLPGVRAGATRYDSTLARAVAVFQLRHGLAVDSAAGPQTLAALNVTAAERATQIAANLERLRWLPRDLGDRYVMVNIPAFRLTAVEHGRAAVTMGVVVGSELADRRTPVFSDSMRYVQFGPYWNVPRSIAEREILPEAQRDRDYLARHNFELVRGWGDDAPVVDATALSDAALLSTRYRVRQRPGPDNALGRVKFMFPNDFNVYLHDTPAQALFGERVRAASHGCVRVADPAALATFVLAGDTAWPAERIRSTLAAGERARADLARPLPVYLLYLTAFDQGGVVGFRDDLYDRDPALVRALGADEDPGAGQRVSGTSAATSARVATAN